MSFSSLYFHKYTENIRRKEKRMSVVRPDRGGESHFFESNYGEYSTKRKAALSVDLLDSYVGSRQR